VFLLHTVNKVPPHQDYQQLANIWSGHSHYLVPLVAKQGVKTVKMKLGNIVFPDKFPVLYCFSWTLEHLLPVRHTNAASGKWKTEMPISFMESPVYTFRWKPPGRANSTPQNDDSCLVVFPPLGYFTTDPKSIEIICTKTYTYMATSVQVTRYLYALHILNLLSIFTN